MSETAVPSQLAAPAGRPIRCVECDLLQYGPAVGDRQSVHCQRCGSPLYKGVRNSVDRTLALLLGALILLIAANTLPFMTFEFKGQSQSNYILSGVLGLWANGYWPLAALICFASILAPMAYILGMLYVIVPVRLGFRPWGAGPFFRLLDGLRPWAMLEVYMFGVFVAVVKLNQLASITPGLGLYAYVALFIVWTAAIAGLDPRVVWAAIGPEPDVDAIRSGARERMISCKSCTLVSVVPEGASGLEGAPGSQLHCPRCGDRMERRKPASLSRTWALLIAAAILYVPANAFPILDITITGKSQATTIFGGVQELFAGGMWEIAAIVFTASILVPTLKLLGLTFLCISVRRRSAARPVDRTVLYRWIEVIGRWSMIDMFMVSILVALVQLGGLATILPDLGALCFASVVVLTMFAAMSFDSRLIWDNLGELK